MTLDFIHISTAECYLIRELAARGAPAESKVDRAVVGVWGGRSTTELLGFVWN